MAPHSSTLALKTPWTEEHGWLQSMRLLRVRHDWVTSLSRIGEGNGNPLQCSCLENPRDGGAWWAAIYGVPQSQTWLKRLSSSSRVEFMLHQEYKRVGRELGYRLKVMLGLMWKRIFCVRMILSKQMLNLDTNLILFFSKFFCCCGPFLKSLLNLLQYCFCFKVWCFGLQAHRIFAPCPGIEPTPALEGEVLITEPPGKSSDPIQSLPLKCSSPSLGFWLCIPPYLLLSVEAKNT